jgi:hypothetical protein
LLQSVIHTLLGDLDKASVLIGQYIPLITPSQAQFEYRWQYYTAFVLRAIGRETYREYATKAYKRVQAITQKINEPDKRNLWLNGFLVKQINEMEKELAVQP